MSLGLVGCGDAPVTRDVILISIDTLRADRLGCTGHVTARTPRLDALARSGTLYPNAVSPTPLTLPAHATILSGLLPIEHGARANRPFVFPDKLPTLATELASRGYHTVAVIGGEPLARGCGLERGFDVYDDALRAGQVGSVRLRERIAGEVTDAALGHIAARADDRPLFLFAHYFDPHDPYTPPAPFASEHAADPYDGEIAYVDQQVGRLLDGLESRGLLSDAIIVVTSDHGESLGEHGEPTHGFFVYDATIRVPLIVRDQTQEAHGLDPLAVIDDQVRLQDLYSFILDRTAGSPHDLLAPSSRGEPAYIESLYAAIHCDHAQLRGLRSPSGTKYLEAGDEELYDLERDPQEQHDLSTNSAHAPQLQSARDSLATLLASFRSAAAEFGVGALPGYLSSPVRAETLRTKTRQENTQRPSPASRATALTRLHEGVRLCELQWYEAAIDELRRAAELDPENPTAFFWLGRAQRGSAETLEDLDDLRAAVASFRRVLALQPEHEEARDLLIFCLAKAGEFEQAWQLGRDAEASASASAKTLEAMGKLRLMPNSPLTERANPLYDEDLGIDYLYRAAAVDPARADPRVLQFLHQRYSLRGDALHAEEIKRWLEARPPS